MDKQLYEFLIEAKKKLMQMRMLIKPIHQEKALMIIIIKMIK